MTRFARAPWPLKAAYLGTLAAASVALLGGLAVVIALAGLKRLSPDIDLAQVPAWFWYFRDDPQVRRWLGVGLLSAFGGAPTYFLWMDGLPNLVPQLPLNDPMGFALYSRIHHFGINAGALNDVKSAAVAAE